MDMCKIFCNFVAQMSKCDALNRIFAYVKHRLTAWNTSGEGIHSPYLFEYVRFVVRDKNAFYCFQDIERRRRLLMACEDELDVVDYGSAGSPEGLHIRRRVCDIAKGHLESASVGQLLFRTVNWTGQKMQRPLEILELGTSLGVTTSYLASADSRNHVVTLEGSGEVLKVAQGVWRALDLENVEWHEGNIDNTLNKCAREKLDIAYVDANHTFDATIRYADFLLPRMSENGMLILDDIHYSREMEHAWEALKNDPRVTTSMDMYHIGILFVNKHFLKKHYKLVAGY